MSYKDRARDQRTADEAVVDQAQLCGAHGCPNRWSVDGGKSRLCSAHAWAPQHAWPQITAEQQDAETDRALQAQMPRSPQEPAPKPDPQRLRSALARLRLSADDPRTPAQRVIDRLRAIASERPLSEAQRLMLQACEARAGTRARISEADDAA